MNYRYHINAGIIRQVKHPMLQHTKTKVTSPDIFPLNAKRRVLSQLIKTAK
jgi:hypothetical protein